MRNRILRITILVTLFLLSACSPERSEVFTSQCAPPCWRGIVPGETRMSEVLSLSKEFTDISKDEISTGGKLSIFNRFTLFKLQDGIEVRIYYLDDIVTVISFYKKSGILSFSDCIDEFGTPESIARVSLLGPGPPIGATSAIHPWIFAIINQGGVVYGYDEYKSFGGNLELSKSDKITVIKFFDIQSYDLLLEAGQLVYTDTAEPFSEEDLYVWKGYGDIDELYPEP